MSVVGFHEKVGVGHGHYGALDQLDGRDLYLVLGTVAPRLTTRTQFEICSHLRPKAVPNLRAVNRIIVRERERLMHGILLSPQGDCPSAKEGSASGDRCRNAIRSMTDRRECHICGQKSTVGRTKNRP